jgi:CRISPR-associated protein Cmr4
MIQITHPLFMMCESPLHAGAGTGIGYIDNPIQRETPTGFPKIEGSSLKGALRERFTKALPSKEGIDLVFGPEPNQGEQESGFRSAISLTDARLLLFPIQSPVGLFAYATCEWVLRRFMEDMKTAGQTYPNKLPTFSQETALAIDGSPILLNNTRLILEECIYSVEPSQSEQVKELANFISTALFGEQDHFSKQKICDSLVILPDNDFRDFVELSTEVITRNRIDSKSGTVADGGLFTEEYLPQESVLYALFQAQAVVENKQAKVNELKDEHLTSPNADQVRDFVSHHFTETIAQRFQLGGNATIGKGLLYANLKTS